MIPSDYDAVMALWEAADGVRPSLGDTPAGVTRFLERNPGLSLVAEEGGRLLGVVLCGHDGRRGYINHVAVAPAARRSGLGRRMVEACVKALAEQGIPRAHLFVVKGNERGAAFWRALGWFDRDDIDLMSIDTGG